jgi:hypothetical protein
LQHLNNSINLNDYSINRIKPDNQTDDLNKVKTEIWMIF